MWTCPLCHVRLPLDDMVLCLRDGSHICPDCAAIRHDDTDTSDLGWFIAIESEILGPASARCTRPAARLPRRRNHAVPGRLAAWRSRTREQ